MRCTPYCDIRSSGALLGYSDDGPVRLPAGEQVVKLSHGGRTHAASVVVSAERMAVLCWDATGGAACE